MRDARETDCVGLVVMLCVEKSGILQSSYVWFIFLYQAEQLFVPFRGTKIIPLILNDQTYNIAVLDHNKDECLVDIDRGQKPSEET